MRSTCNPAFVRRANTFGTTDSICKACFVIIAAAHQEVDLKRAEQRHACDPAMLDLWMKLVDEIILSAERQHRQT
jgi:hypothetical protein